MRRLIGPTLALLVCVYGIASAEPSRLNFAARTEGPEFSHRTPSNPYIGEVVDLNGDGRPEIVQTYFNHPPDMPNRAEPIKVLAINPATLTFFDATTSYLSTPIPSFVHPRVFAKGDFNGDGKQDLFIGGHGYDAAPSTGERDWVLNSRLSNTHLSTRLSVPPNFTHAAATGDIDHDGLADVYVGPLGAGATGPYFLLGRQSGSMAPVFDRLAPLISQGTAFTAAALVEIDGRRGPDLVLGTSGGRTSIAYLNNGNGSFNRSPPDLVLPAGRFGITNTIVLDMMAGDLNTDGRPDLVLSETRLNPFYAGYALQVLIGNGQAFVDESSRILGGSSINPNGAWKHRVMPADFFGDGIIDFVAFRACPTGPADYVIWINDGAGRFQPQNRSLFETGVTYSECAAIYPIDINKDGRSDLAWLRRATDTSQRIWTYVNQGVSPGGTAPSVVRAPVATSVPVGQPLTLSVSAQGARPLRFQWFKNGVAIPGAVRPVFRLNAVTLAVGGHYRVRVSNAVGSTFTSPVPVTVNR